MLNSYLLWCNILLQLIDGITTYLGLAKGLFESNRILNFLAHLSSQVIAFSVLLWIIKLTIIFSLILLWNALGLHPSQDKHRKGIFGCLALVMVSVCVWNFLNIASKQS